MMLICVDDNCKQKCRDILEMQLHRQTAHREQMYKSMENTAISLVEAVLAKHDLIATKEKVDRVIALLEKGI